MQAKRRRISCYPPGVPGPRTCTVTLRDLDGVTHTVQVQRSSLYEAAARAVAAFREHGWAAEALTLHATLRVEVHAPTVVHEMPSQRGEKIWINAPSTSPKDAAVEGAYRGGSPGQAVKCPGSLSM